MFGDKVNFFLSIYKYLNSYANVVGLNLIGNNLLGVIIKKTCFFLY